MEHNYLSVTLTLYFAPIFLNDRRRACHCFRHAYAATKFQYVKPVARDKETLQSNVGMMDYLFLLFFFSCAYRFWYLLQQPVNLPRTPIGLLSVLFRYANSQTIPQPYSTSKNFFSYDVYGTVFIFTKKQVMEYGINVFFNCPPLCDLLQDSKGKCRDEFRSIVLCALRTVWADRFAFQCSIKTTGVTYAPNQNNKSITLNNNYFVIFAIRYIHFSLSGYTLRIRATTDYRYPSNILI